MPEWKVQQFNDFLAKNEDTLNIISRHQGWITVNSKTKDRKRPLEKMKAANMEVTSKIMPKWMEIKHKNTKREEILKSTQYSPIKQKCKRQMAFVDRNINPKKCKLPLEYNPNRTVFSLGDFRHNVISKEQRLYNDSKVNQKPLRFFDWDDGKKFNPKTKKDK